MSRRNALYSRQKCSIKPRPTAVFLNALSRHHGIIYVNTNGAPQTDAPQEHLLPDRCSCDTCTPNSYSCNSEEPGVDGLGEGSVQPKRK